jgi:hypothetical protein
MKEFIMSYVIRNKILNMVYSIISDLNMTGTEKRDWKGYTLILVRNFRFSFCLIYGVTFCSHRFAIVMLGNWPWIF